MQNWAEMGTRRLGSLYDLMPAPADKVVMPMDEWNHVRIVSQGKDVTFWLNGKKTVEFERGSAEFRAAVAVKANSKIFPILASGRTGIFYCRNTGSEVFSQHKTSRAAVQLAAILTLNGATILKSHLMLPPRGVVLLPPFFLTSSLSAGQRFLHRANLP